MGPLSRNAQVFLLTIVASLALPATTAQAAPSNDAFAAAVALGAVPSTRTGSTAGATMEAGEPAPCGEIGATVWFRLTTSADAFVVADTFGSSHDTVLAAYRGTSLQSLGEIQCNDDSGSGLQSMIGFSATAGEPVYLQLGGYDGETGSFRLKLSIGGGLSGTVTDHTRNPLGDVCVIAVTPEDEGSEVLTDAQGRYRFGGLPPGGYQVHFSDCAEEARVSDEWFDDAPTQAEADVVQVVAGQETNGIDAALAPAARIRGRVTSSSGTPLDEVCVLGYEVGQTEYEEGSFASTGSDGRYVLSGIGAGRYAIRFEDCAGRDLATEWYDDADARSGAMIIEVAAGEDRGGIDAVLTSGGSIAGRVMDESGAPVPYACVAAVDRDGSHVGWGDANGSGVYEVVGLHAGSYSVRFEDCDGNGLAPEWYDDQPNRASANQVVVTEGGRTTGVDARLGPGATLSGLVTDREGNGLFDVYVGVYDDAQDEIAWSYTDEDGAYTVRGLPPGQHRVMFEDWGGASFAPEWYDDRGSFEQATPVTVTAGGSVDGVDAVLDRLAVDAEETDGRTSVEEGGASDTYSLRLSAQPSAAVQVALETDTAQLTVTPPAVVFTEETWDVPQEVTVAAVDDLEEEGLHRVPILHVTSSEDERWEGARSAPLDVLIIDDELRAAETELTYTGPASGYRGQEVSLEAMLTEAGTGLPVADAEVVFGLEDEAITTWTGPDGAAEAVLPLDLAPGTYQMEVRYEGDPTHHGSSLVIPFEVRWQYTFEDQRGAGRMYLNPATREFRLIAGTIDSGIRSEPGMVIGPGGSLVTLVHRGSSLAVAGEFDLATGRFAATGRSGTQPFALGRA